MEIPPEPERFFWLLFVDHRTGKRTRLNTDPLTKSEGDLWLRSLCGREDGYYTCEEVGTTTLDFTWYLGEDAPCKRGVAFATRHPDPLSAIQAALVPPFKFGECDLPSSFVRWAFGGLIDRFDTYPRSLLAADYYRMDAETATRAAASVLDKWVRSMLKVARQGPHPSAWVPHACDRSLLGL